MTEFEHYLSISAVDTNQDTSELIGCLWMRQKASKHKIEFDFSCRQRGCSRSSMTSLIESIHRVSFEAVWDWHSTSLPRLKVNIEHFSVSIRPRRCLEAVSVFSKIEAWNTYNFSFSTSPKRHQTLDNVNSFFFREKLALRNSLNLRVITLKNVGRMLKVEIW